MSRSSPASAVGISPVLLQAINQTLGSSAKQTPMEVKQEHSIKGEQDPDGPPGVSIIPQTSETIVLIQNVQGGTDSGNQIVIKYPEGSQVGERAGTSQEMNMGSILSAIANHFKNSNKRVADESGTSAPLIIMPSQSLPSVPSPSHDAHDIALTQDIITTETVVTSESPEPKRVRQEYADSTSETTYIVDTSSLEEGTMLQTVNEDGTVILSPFTTTPIVTSPSSGLPEIVSGPCPICSDRISGYHYGIYTCESCKGFFKRTVQNKKAFHCHKQGDCDITLGSRKKCPACRFKRCLVAGMKLEAIREDRMRGGRSSYEGATPVSKPKPAFPKKENKPRRVTTQHETSQTVMVSTSTGPVYAVVDVIQETSQDYSKVGDLGSPGQPQTPQFLEDLVTLESLMDEDEEEQECCHGKLRAGDDDIFNSLLHIADHCLYKIVRWARNLPEFSSVCTDDQILLLQSCWAELLCLATCWYSHRGQSDELMLSHGRALNMPVAEAIGFQDTIQRLLDFTDQLRQLDMDKHEYVAMKVIILMNPDVKSLKNADIVREQQERVMESILVYSLTHYPDQPGKHCHLLARIPELTRTCSISKELLNARQAAGDIPQFSLLSELLKGDVVVQQAQD